MSDKPKNSENKKLENKPAAKNKSKVDIAKPVLLWTGITLGVLLLLSTIIAFGAFAYMRMYEGKIYPGVKVLDIRLDGQTPNEARETLIKATDSALKSGLHFSLDGQEVNLQASANSDLPDIVLYDIDKAVSDSYNIGRADELRKVLYQILRSRIRAYNLDVNISIDERRVEEALLSEYKDKLFDPVDATFEISTYQDEPPEVIVIPDKDGKTLDTQGVFDKLKAQAQILDFKTITLHIKDMKAERQSDELSAIINSVKEVLSRPQLVLTHEDEEFKIDPKMLAGWIVSADDGVNATIDKTAFASSVHMLAKEIEMESKTGKMEVKDGKIVSFEAGTLGRVVNIDKTLEPILTSWPPTSTFPLVVEEEHGKITGNNLEELGIVELIGVGKSNFRGSPYNRTRNITKAVEDHVNGTLLAPGEEFSMLKALGEIDGAHGWLPELVIKGNETKPEYGGGLCQIGTTMFRGAVDTGLKITERRNHSYRVSYYEPAGTDATIYDPAPDFRFLNDTSKHVYINAYIVGTEIIFEFWGTNDGRNVEVGKPIIYNITAAPPTKLIETTDLAPGKKKCTESAHAGADAKFSTTITYADGQVREETFLSHYRPWQAVCLIGVEKPATDTEAGDGSEVVPVEE
ncbi:MAG: VanW family protein [Patescibacteria group bacterium]|nr:VanW family protein [Patescibacteria group bacterium]